MYFNFGLYPLVNGNQTVVGVARAGFNSHVMFDDYYYIPLASKKINVSFKKENTSDYEGSSLFFL